MDLKSQLLFVYLRWDISFVNEVFWATFWATAIKPSLTPSSLSSICNTENPVFCYKRYVLLETVDLVCTGKSRRFLEIRFQVLYTILTTAMFEYKQAFTRGIFHDGFVMHKSVWISSWECNLTTSYLYLTVHYYVRYFVTNALVYPHESNELIHTRLGKLWITLNDWNLFIHKKHC